MAKRFTDNEKWLDPWFMDLKPEHKLAWLFMLDHCDLVGVWKPNFRLMAFTIGEMVNEKEFLELLKHRVFLMPNGNWWIVKFCAFQYGELKEETLSRPHLKYISLLKSHRLWIGYSKGINTLKDKDKEEDKEEKEEEDPPKFVTRFTIPPTISSVENYMHEQATLAGKKLREKIEAEMFYDHYESNGWKIGGKSKMKDWQAAVRKWLRNDFTNGNNGSSQKSPQHIGPQDYSTKL